MKRILLLVGIVAIFTSITFAQSSKAEKKAAKEAEGNAKFERALAAIEAKDFVIIVDYYHSNRMGVTIQNLDNSNFFSYERQNAFVQGVIFFGENYPNSHKLDVSNYKHFVDKKGNVRVEMIVIGNMTRGRVEISMTKGNNYADVIYTMRDFKVRYSGEVVPTALSKYIKGPNQV